jgi:hypothetical protein
MARLATRFPLFSTKTIGGSISIPLRIFDRIQGEQVRTQIDIGR